VDVFCNTKIHFSSSPSFFTVNRYDCACTFDREYKLTVYIRTTGQWGINSSAIKLKGLVLFLCLDGFLDPLLGSFLGVVGFALATLGLASRLVGC
jgi:hypothetical protein